MQTFFGAHSLYCSVVSGVLFPEVRGPEREVNDLTPSSAEFKNEWSLICISLYTCMACTGNVHTKMSGELATSILRAVQEHFALR